MQIYNYSEAERKSQFGLDEKFVFNPSLLDQY